MTPARRSFSRVSPAENRRETESRQAAALQPVCTFYSRLVTCSRPLLSLSLRLIFLFRQRRCLARHARLGFSPHLRASSFTCEWVCSRRACSAGDSATRRRKKFLPLSSLAARPRCSRTPSHTGLERQSILPNLLDLSYVLLPPSHLYPHSHPSLGASSCPSERINVIEVPLSLCALLAPPQAVQLAIEALTRSNDLPPGLHSGAEGVED